MASSPVKESEVEEGEINGNSSESMGNGGHEKLSWYHPNMDRHLSEGLLMTNGIDGSYLLRPRKKGGLSLSVRCANSVKHFRIGWDGQKYTFGMGKFDCLDEFIEHFENKPLIGSDSGILTLLKYPYPRYVEEPEEYDTVRVHAEWGKSRDGSVSDSKTNCAIATREGYLTKQGGRVKNWKTRWFVVVGTDLKYYRVKGDKLPAKTLDLTQCQEVEQDNTQGKTNCFRSQRVKAETHEKL